MLRLKYLNREQIVFPESHDTPITGYERKTSLHANVSIFFPAPVGQRAKKKKENHKNRKVAECRNMQTQVLAKS